MKKTALTPTQLKLSLNRETLRELQDPSFMKDVAAGVSVRPCGPFTTWPTCDPIT
ncbi:MAG: hypothetical protein QOJ16_636 [Acidobacteriota bacterium]|jgi:hypothetical protein|nr:hypothetical protein [Acidobacteriota bacterium]